MHSASQSSASLHSLLHSSSVCPVLPSFLRAGRLHPPPAEHRVLWRLLCQGGQNWLGCMVRLAKRALLLPPLCCNGTACMRSARRLPARLLPRPHAAPNLSAPLAFPACLLQAGSTRRLMSVTGLGSPRTLLSYGSYGAYSVSLDNRLCWSREPAALHGCWREIGA